MLDQKTIAKAVNSNDSRIKCVGVGNCRGNTNLSRDFVNALRKAYDPDKRQAAMLACANAEMPPEWIFDGLNDYDFSVRAAAVEALRHRDDVCVEQIARLLNSEWWHERYAGVNACVCNSLPLKQIRKWIGFGTFGALPVVFYEAAAAACIDNTEVPYGLVERIIRGAKSAKARRMAARAFRGQEVPEDKILAMLHSPNEYMQLAGLNAYRSEMAIPYVEIGEKLISENVCIRRVAAMVCDKSRPKILRVIEPGAQVYKKCAGGVIVVAGIPEDAQIRGNESQGYRADKAIIQDIIGDFCGKSVGVSLYDHTVEYRVGDEVAVADYDFSYNAMGSGFHFFTEFARAEEF